MTDREAIEILDDGEWWGYFNAIEMPFEIAMKFHYALDCAVSALKDRIILDDIIG